MSNPCLDALTKAGLSFLPLDEARDAWRDLVVRSGGAVHYAPGEVAYQREYMTGAAEHYHDGNVLLVDGGTPLAVWPLCAWSSGGGWRIGSNAMDVLEPLAAAGLGWKRHKEVLRQCLDALDELARALGLASWRSVEFTGPRGFSEWQARQMDRGGRIVSVRHDLRVDLQASEEDIRSAFRKSYKPLISKAARLWQVEVIDGTSPALADTYAAFRQLHLEVAGRVTRSARSWDLHLDAIRGGEGFLVAMRAENGALVGVALFSYTASDAVYAVAAYRRELFDQPIGHLAQMTAIRHLKALGVPWYRVGIRPYAGDPERPTDKELAIGLFKEGFASHRFPCVTTEVPVRPAVEAPAELR